ncbi:hypothetical protein F528_0283 [Neisseria meningitidis 992008]|nr:hypothetical protein F528_0283 [Neisseria meningitidis 992008]
MKYLIKIGIFKQRQCRLKLGNGLQTAFRSNTANTAAP